ncbi:MAG TPA: YIP1 family protein, partial [Salinivirgaceae bacterium]|nr:YIP1 family protein [Salinivirgaceae bacterium]
KVMKKKTNNWSLIWNPFIRIAGWQAFGVGIVIVVISAVLASYGNLVFDGAVDAHFGSNVGVAKSLIITGISLFSVVLTMYVVGIIISKNFRFVDILGTMTLARAPYLLLAVLAPFATFPDIEQILQNPMIVLEYPFIIIFGVISLPVLIWSIALMYNGLKVSTGAKGMKLTVGFIVGILAAEIISKLFIHLIL